ncbi:acyl-CoA dehydrogenase family protein [Pararoseomonas indoligenes]|uniref:Acyl-CoA dehydrogenase family protein n=1 Tax=Roseomonas indoligenes TaxID=2820811 RepID=A0A940S969_9PROT|nr:acyl-CoA dehydrogenase family protein [Pararoseomonas indoligenes]MBP0494938.1 acyl-CoA dehydrogenase family protein [Pararoseomonas indoligenes]
MEFKISEAQREMIVAVRALAQTEFRRDAAKWMDGTFPWPNMKRLAELGVLGMSVPEEYGGLGLSILDSALILEEIAKVDYVTAMAVLGEAGVQTRVISHYAPKAIKERILPRVVSGDCILAICMTEPDAGTDVANYRTNTVRKGNHLVLNGAKTLISRAEEAGMFVVFTRVEGKPGREGIGCVLVERGTPGLAVTGTYHTMGGENLHEVQFNDVELPPENLVIEEDGFRKLLTAFNTQRCLNPSISLGLAEGAFDEAVSYVKERKIFGKAIASSQGIRWKFADMFREIEAARGLLYRACMTASPFPDPIMAATAKVFCNEMSIRVTSEAIQVHGGYGFTDEYPVSRLFRGARYGSLGGGSSESLRDLVGKRILEGADLTDGILSLDTY